MFAAKRYASSIERNPDDYDALYNWALVLHVTCVPMQPSNVCRYINTCCKYPMSCFTLLPETYALHHNILLTSFMVELKFLKKKVTSTLHSSRYLPFYPTMSTSDLENTNLVYISFSFVA